MSPNYISEKDILLGLLLVALCLLTWIMPLVVWGAGPPGYLPGDIFVTRNATEAENSSPGYWNHVAVYVGNGLVVEAQGEPGKVIYSDLAEFVNRYPEIRLLRLRMGDRQAIADEAIRQVGTPYRALASIPVFMRRPERGNNCVSVFRRGLRSSTGVDPRFRVPDGVIVNPTLEIIGAKP